MLLQYVGGSTTVKSGCDEAWFASEGDCGETFVIAEDCAGTSPDWPAHPVAASASRTSPAEYFFKTDNKNSPPCKFAIERGFAIVNDSRPTPPNPQCDYRSPGPACPRFSGGGVSFYDVASNVVMRSAAL